MIESFGHKWELRTQTENPSPEKIGKRAQDFFENTRDADAQGADGNMLTRRFAS